MNEEAQEHDSIELGSLKGYDAGGREMCLFGIKF